MRKRWPVLAVLAALTVVAGGCRTEPAAEIFYGSVNPGPWKDVGVRVLPGAGKVTVKVANYRASPADYVWKIMLTDKDGVTSLGSRVFSYGDEPEVTFILAPRVRGLVVTVVSTARGTWRSGAVAIPEPAPGG